MYALDESDRNAAARGRGPLFQLFDDRQRGGIHDIDRARRLARHVHPAAVGARGDALGFFPDLDGLLHPLGSPVHDRHERGVFVRDEKLRPVLGDRELLGVRTARQTPDDLARLRVDDRDAVGVLVGRRNRPLHLGTRRHGATQGNEDEPAVRRALHPARPLADGDLRDDGLGLQIDDAEVAAGFVAHEGARSLWEGTAARRAWKMRQAGPPRTTTSDSVPDGTPRSCSMR